jgi:hypothetical protein
MSVQTAEQSQQRIERWRALLKMGVALRIPAASMPYADVDRSTLHWLGWDQFEQQDEWHAYEAGHGRYGSVQKTDLSRGELDERLAQLAQQPEDSVTPWKSAAPELDRVSAAETLPRALRGEVALTWWFDPSARGATDLVLGDGDALYWLRLEGERFARVERLGSLDISLLESLFVPRDSIVERNSMHGAMLTRAQRHLDRHDELVRALDADPMRYLGRADGREGTTRGHSRFHWLSFWPAAPGESVTVVDQTPFVVASVVARALFEDPSASLRTAPPGLRAELSRREFELAAVYDALHGGTLAYQQNTSISLWWLWLDGAPYEVSVTHDRRPSSVTSAPALRPPTVHCAGYAQHHAHAEQFHRVDPEWVAAVRALLPTTAR